MIIIGSSDGLLSIRCLLITWTSADWSSNVELPTNLPELISKLKHTHAGKYSEKPFEVTTSSQYLKSCNTLPIIYIYGNQPETHHSTWTPHDGNYACFDCVPGSPSGHRLGNAWGTSMIVSDYLGGSYRIFLIISSWTKAAIDLGLFSIQRTSFQGWDSLYKDKTVVRPSYLYDGNLYIGKTYLYWDRSLQPNGRLVLNERFS